MNTRRGRGIYSSNDTYFFLGEAYFSYSYFALFVMKMENLINFPVFPTKADKSLIVPGMFHPSILKNIYPCFEGLLFFNTTLFIPSENSQYFFHSLCKGKGTLWNLEDFFQQKAAFFMIIPGIFSTFKLGNSVKWYQSGPASYSHVWYAYFRCSCWIAVIIKL